MSVIIKKTSRNFFDKSKVINATETATGFSFTNKNVSAAPVVIGKLRELCPNLKVGDVVTHYGTTVNNGYGGKTFFYLVGTSSVWYQGTFVTITQAALDGDVNAYGNQNMLCEYNDVIITKEANAPYEPYSEYKSSKNLLNNTAKTQTINGVTFTVNDDGSVTVNGTATAFTYYIMKSNFTVPANTILSGCPSGGHASSGYTLVMTFDGLATRVDTGNGVALHTEDMACKSCYIQIAPGVTVTDITFYPMLRLDYIEDDTYEPYIEPKTLPTSASKAKVIKDGITTFLKTIKVISGGVETVVWKAGSTVTYYYDESGVGVTEERDGGEDILTPNTFTPALGSWKFIGWKEDTSADANVLTSKTMDDKPIVLYAVYTKDVTVKFISGSNQANTNTITGTRYYNVYGTKVNVTLTAPAGASLSGWSFRGWGSNNNTAADASVAYDSGSTMSDIGGDRTYYGLYQKTITLSYDGNASTGGSTASHPGTGWYNSYGNHVYPTFTLKANGFTRTDCTFIDWAQGSVDGTRCNPGDSVTLTASTTFYAKWMVNETSFGYTGGIQQFVAQVAGTYKLICYGAQGGGTYGGKGGYAYGNVKLTKGQVIYVVVGGQNAYNGGGSGSGGGTVGGGATHIGKSNAVLKSTTSSNVLLVAGGGGGAANSINGGTGGGTSGGNGSGSGNGDHAGGNGGTQSAGGSGHHVQVDEDWPGVTSGSGSFGQGGAGVAGSGSMIGQAGGGGGGYYGGGGGASENSSASGGGGSGYIGGCISGTTGMSNGQKSGNGSASITLVSVA